MKYAIVPILVLLLAFPNFAGEALKLNYNMLEPGIVALPDSDRDAVRGAIKLIQDGEHSLALARLSSLDQQTRNSSLRILASFALLQLGNLVGAFEEAQKAHEAPYGSAFTCWFFAKVALLSGKTNVCKREISHVKKSGQMVAEVNELEKEIEKR